MTLKKQSIRSNMHVYAVIENAKEDLIENCQSGQISHAVLDVYRNEPLPAKGVTYKIDLKERSDINSNGDKPVKVPPIPGERTF